MEEDYKKKYKELKLVKEVESKQFNIIYIIPSTIYDGFWGKNGYRSFDIVLGNNNKMEGWFHWEGDVINFNNCSFSIDSEQENKFIRLFTNSSEYGFKLRNTYLSSMVIEIERNNK